MATELIFGLSPISFIALVAIAVSLGFVLSYKLFSDQATMRELKKDLKKYQRQMREVRRDPEKMKELSQKSLEANLKYMKASMKPMFITIIPLLFLFGWLKKALVGLVVIPLAFWPGHLGWLGSYILFSIIFTTLFRKVLKVA